MTEAVEVTQADREVAAYNAVLTEMRDLILAGKADHHAEPFARHRIAHQQDIAAQREDAARQALEAAADWFADRFSDAVQADCENGVKWLNERAAKAYLKDAPDTLAAIREGEEAIRAIDPARFRGEG